MTTDQSSGHDAHCGIHFGGVSCTCSHALGDPRNDEGGDQENEPCQFDQSSEQRVEEALPDISPLKLDLAAIAANLEECDDDVIVLVANDALTALVAYAAAVRDLTAENARLARERDERTPHWGIDRGHHEEVVAERDRLREAADRAATLLEGRNRLSRDRQIAHLLHAALNPSEQADG